MAADQPKSKPDVIVAGHICLDIIPTLPKGSNYRELLIPGRLLQLGPVVVSTGGPVSNTGLALHKLGVRTQLMAKVGDDVFGKVILELVRSHHPRLVEGMKVATGEGGSYSIILTVPAIDRILLHCPGCNDTFCAADIDYDIAASARIFHFGYPPMMKSMYCHNGEELMRMLQRIKASGVVTSVDMVMPDPDTPAGKADWRAILKRVLPYIDLFLPSVEEMLLLLDRNLFDELAARAGQAGILSVLVPRHLSDMAETLLEMGAAVVSLKAGHLGLYLRSAGSGRLPPMLNASDWAKRELWAPCFKTCVVGTTGSGDATIAGFLTGVLHGLGPVEAMTGAVGTGACNVEAADALGGIIPWPQLQERIVRGWERLPLDIDAAGWRFDDQQNVWIGPKDGMAVN